MSVSIELRDSEDAGVTKVSFHLDDCDKELGIRFVIDQTSTSFSMIDLKKDDLRKLSEFIIDFLDD